MSIDGYRLSTSAASREHVDGNWHLSKFLASAALFMMYEGSDSMMGFRIMSKYNDTTYVTQPILAQIGRTGGVFPGMNGGGHGYGIGSF